MNNFKKNSVVGLFLLALSLTVMSAGIARADLFQSARGKSKLNLPAPAHAAILRQQAADIRWEALDGCRAEVIELNLFEDVRLLALRDSVELSPTGGCAWLGTVIEPEQGDAVLVLENGKLSGTITLANRSFQIRPLEAVGHMVRELDRRLLEPERLALSLSALPQEAQVLVLVNQERALQGLGPLTENGPLGIAARAHSEDMAANDYFSHDSQDGRTPWDRIADAGYSCGSCGENIAAGYSTPAVVMNGWMNSSGHRANILNSAYCDLGVGYAYDGSSQYGNYWTQDFGRKPGVSACSAVQTLTITATALAGGKISPSGQVAVLRGASKPFKITPNTGYRILDVLVDGASAGRVGTYSFTNVTANHTIKARFVKKPIITLSAPSPGGVELPVKNGVFRVTRANDLVTSLVVYYAVTGTATTGVDYRTLSGRVVIPAGSSTAYIKVFPLDDAAKEGPETVTVTLQARSTYVLGTSSRSTVTIAASD